MRQCRHDAAISGNPHSADVLAEIGHSINQNRIGGNLTTSIRSSLLPVPKECLVANNKNPNEKQPGENPEGKYHFNPGNMAGKEPGDAEQTAENRGEPHDKEKPAG